jgi:hypothetical protein
MGKKLEITQDVFVKVKKAQDIAQLKEPLCPHPDVSSCFSASASDVAILRISRSSQDITTRSHRSSGSIVADPAYPRTYRLLYYYLRSRSCEP